MMELPYDDGPLMGLLLAIFAFTVLCLILAIYASIYRYINVRNDRLDKLYEKIWRPPVLESINHGPEKCPPPAIEVGRRAHFVDFLARYASRLSSTERVNCRKMAEPYLDAVVARAANPIPETRVRALHVLKTLGSPKHLEVARKLLDDKQTAVAYAAMCVLAQCDDVELHREVISRIHRFTGWHRTTMIPLLYDLGKLSPEFLRDTFRDTETSPLVRALAADALSELYDMTASDVAVEILSTEDENAEVFAAALRLLARTGRPDHANRVRLCCLSDIPLIRRFAVSALAEVGTKHDAPIIEQSLDDPNHWVALAAAKSLSRLGEKARLQALIDKDHPRAPVAAEMLSLMEAA